MNEVDKYISSFPPDVQDILRKIRTIIKETAPEAEEGFAYRMPSYMLNKKPLVYFAGYKSHIGFYATPTGHERFATQLSDYKQGKGSVRFPLKKPIPYDLIREITAYRVSENK